MPTTSTPGAVRGTAGPQPGERWARYQLRRRIGEGGMGVVFAAHDPELDREVALKVLHDEHLGSAAQQRLRGEARAMARIAHANVVPVYEVGEHAARSYYTMELVRGRSVRDWLREPRTWPEIQRVFLDAARGIQAIHAAGLVHRDVKPGNMLLGEDGRTRIVDLGLACEADGSDPEHRVVIAGTPRYMAPEQAAGAVVTPAADQYSFCVSLAEALGTDAEVAATTAPRWVRAVIERGRAADPAARFGSMAELSRALSRDLVRTRQWRVALAALAALAVVGGVAFVLGRAAPGREEVCTGAEAELEATWAAEARAASLARIASLGAYGQALAPQVDGVVRDHARRWVSGHRDACLAHRRGAQSDELLDRRMACLARGRAALAAVADIVGSAEPGTLAEVALAARALPDPDACADVNALLAGAALPPAAIAGQVTALRDKTERARVLIAAGRTAEARDLAGAAIDEARPLGYSPALAEALLVQGHAMMSMPGRTQAVPALAEATRTALTLGADALAVEAWARRAWVEGTTGDPAAALAGLDVIEALAARPTTSRFARALLHNNLGSLELAGGRRDRARAAFTRALEESAGVPPPGGAELIAIRFNLALVADDLAQRDRLLVEAEAELERLYGASHPVTLEVRSERARLMVALAPAEALLAQACEAYELHHGYEQRSRTCWANVGLLRRERGDDAGAVAALERAERFGTADEPTSEVAAYLMLWRGDAAAAAARFADQLARLPPQPETATWHVHNRARLELGLGRAWRAAGELDRARSALEASVADLLAADYPSAKHLLARARAELAMTLAGLGEPRAVVAPIAALALAWLEQAESRADDLATLRRLAGD